MLGQSAQALECLRSEGVQSVDPSVKAKFDNLATGLKETSPVSVKTLNLLNQSSVHLCSGQVDQAKQCFDQVLD